MPLVCKIEAKKHTNNTKNQLNSLSRKSIRLINPKPNKPKNEKKKSILIKLETERNITIDTGNSENLKDIL